MRNLIEKEEDVTGKRFGALFIGALGAVLYGAIAMATPPSGVSNPTWSPVVGRFGTGIDATAKADIDSGSATDFWQIRISAKGATDVHVLENIITPGGTFGWHSHPGPSLASSSRARSASTTLPTARGRTSGPGRRWARPSSIKATIFTWFATTDQSTRTST